MLYDNTRQGLLNTDSMVRALLQHRNTPMQEIGLSPAQLLYGCPIRDHLPGPNNMANIHPEWLHMARDRETALSKRNIRNAETFNTLHGARDLVPLCSGDVVAVQNMAGSAPRR